MEMKTIFINDIPEDVHRNFKVACVKKGKPMREILIDFMVHMIEQNGGENNENRKG